MTTLRQAVEAKVMRMRRVPEHSEWLRKQNEKMDDWYGWCRHCGEALEGTLQQLREHRCGAAS